MNLPNDGWKEIPGYPFHYMSTREVPILPRPTQWINEILASIEKRPPSIR